MTPVDPRLTAALGVQFEARRRALAAGATPVGWKLGMGDRERIGDEIALGHLTSVTRLEPGAAYRAGAAGALHADAEVAVALGRDVAAGAGAEAAWAAIAGYGVALEIVDLARPPDDPAAVVAENIFHRAVAFGPLRPALPAGALHGRLTAGGATTECPADREDLPRRVAAAARLLGALGERLRAGDLLITGSVVQVAIRPGEEVAAEIDGLGRVALSIVP